MRACARAWAAVQSAGGVEPGFGGSRGAGAAGGETVVGGAVVGGAGAAGGAVVVESGMVECYVVVNIELSSVFGVLVPGWDAAALVGRLLVVCVTW